MTDNNLTEKQKTLISCVERLNTPSTSDLEDDDEASDLYSSHNSLLNALSNLAEDDYLNCDRGNPNTWSLKEKGRRILRAIQQRQQRQTDDIADFNAVEEFADFFKQAASDELARAEANESHIFLDLDKLGRFNSELEQQVLTNPKEMIEDCQEALTTYCGLDATSQLEVRIKNVPDIYHKTISDLSSYDLEQLVTIKGVIQSVTAPMLEVTWAEFQCVKCDNVYPRKQTGSKVKKPYKCGQCSGKEFRETDREYTTVRFLHVKEQPGQKMRSKIVVAVRGNLAIDERQNLQATGSGINITGYLEPYKARKTADAFKVRLLANHVEIDDDKWENVEITPDDHDAIQAIADAENTKDIVVRNLARDAVKNQHLVKEAIAVWLLGKTAEGNIHTLIFGDPGTGKSAIGNYLNSHMPRVVKSVATGASGVGLTASVSKDSLTGEWIAEAGAMAMADGGFHITDEIDKLSDSEDISNMNEALSDQSITLDKASIHTEISADVSELAIGNPKGSTLVQQEPAYTQQPIDDSKSDLKDRFDIFLCVKKNDLSVDEQKQKEREVVRHMIRRNQKLDVSVPDAENGDDEVMRVDEELLIKYFAYAQQVQPQLTEEAAELMEDLFFGVQNPETDGEFWGRRQVMSLKKVAIAFARMNLSEHVEVEHVSEASDFLRRTYESMDFNIGKDSLEKMSSADMQKRETVKNAVSLLEQQNGDEPVDIEDVLEEVSLSEEETERVINDLKSEGELFEPANGKIKHL
ncbi:minichromosome maintenance protein MCM [Halorarum salinum]|uniref:Minichromosome maintenance protein MCM n=1 Tax=Halorarum salinum TaxID=2743089 RepID=A0A7D5QAQ3_9EURY|nr:minichromosome maintenance protein MCM [Halobaculum salinum]QLG61958.1 minichromosome maintenance protein MCM [Halobaculum salinum]